jgi:hypothetical protein
MGEVLWRLLNISIFGIGLFSFARLAGEKSQAVLFPLMTLVAVPLAWDCARNGQATLAMTGLMLMAVVDVARGQWWRATLWLMLSVALKPLSIVLVLLLMAIDRPMTWRLLLGLVALALFPFLMQHPAYVVQQYTACLQNTMTAAHVGVVAQGWTTPFTALRVAGIDVPERIQTAIRMIAAVVTLGFCFLARKRHDTARSAVYVFSFAAAYIILFSPRTENNTYVMLGPAIGVFIALALLVEKRKAVGTMLSVLTVSLLASRPLTRLLAPQTAAIWMSPLMGSCFGIYLLARFFTDPATKE